MFTVLCFDSKGNFEIDVASRVGYDKAKNRLWFRVVGDDNTYYFDGEKIDKEKVNPALGMVLKQNAVDLRSFGRYKVELPDYMQESATEAVAEEENVDNGPSVLNKVAQSVGEGAKTLGAATGRAASGLLKNVGDGLAKAKADSEARAAKRAAEAEKKRIAREAEEAEQRRLEEERAAKEAARKARREALAQRTHTEEAQLDEVVSAIQEAENAVAAAADAELDSVDFDDIAKGVERAIAEEVGADTPVATDTGSLKEITQLRLDTDLTDLDLDAFLADDGLTDTEI